MPYLSAYLDSIGSGFRHAGNFGVNFRHGANFATGGATILRPNKTVFESGVSPFYLDVQLAHFDQFKARTTSMYEKGERSIRNPNKQVGSLCLWSYICEWPAKSAFQKRRLPRPEDFPKALYMLDIGQNDISAGLSKQQDELRAYILELVDKLSAAVRVRYRMKLF